MQGTGFRVCRVWDAGYPMPCSCMHVLTHPHALLLNPHALTLTLCLLMPYY